VTALGETGVARSPDSGSTPLASTKTFSFGYADVAQLAEHFTRNEGVGGSNPSVSTTNKNAVSAGNRVFYLSNGGAYGLFPHRKEGRKDFSWASRDAAGSLLHKLNRFLHDLSDPGPTKMGPRGGWISTGIVLRFVMCFIG
jgi:hypothetical protein